MLFLAETSRKGTPSSSASCWPCSVETALFLSVALVSNKDFVYSLASVLLNVGIPGSDVDRLELRFGREERGEATHFDSPFVSHIINKKNAHRSTVVCCCNGTKAFLPCSVPDLKFHPLAIQFDGTDFEINSNSGDEGVKESSLNRRRQHDFPTPESQINNNLIYHEMS